MLEHVTEGTTLTQERDPGVGENDADLEPGFSASQQAAMEQSLQREDELGLFPRDRFLEALDGRLSMERYTAEALRHVAARMAQYRRTT
jgi:hypothetical protein